MPERDRDIPKRKMADMAQVSAKLASRRPPYMRTVGSRGTTAKRRVVSDPGNRTWQHCGSGIKENRFTPGRATDPLFPVFRSAPTKRSDHDEPVIPIRRPISPQNGRPDEVQIKEVPLLHRVNPRVMAIGAPAPQQLYVTAMSRRKPAGHHPYIAEYLSRVHAMAA